MVPEPANTDSPFHTQHIIIQGRQCSLNAVGPELDKLKQRENVLIMATTSGKNNEESMVLWHNNCYVVLYSATYKGGITIARYFFLMQ